MSHPSQTPSTIGELSCNSNVEPWTICVTINPCLFKETSWCRVFCFLTVVHSFTHVRSSIQDKMYRCLILDFTLQVELELQHDGRRLVTYIFPEGRTIRVLFHACAVQKPILSLGCLAHQEYWSDLRADTGTLFFPDKIQTKHSQTQLHKEESLFFVKEMLVAPLSTAGV